MIDEQFCTYCCEKKSKIFAKNSKSGKRLYTDAAGNDWVGARCPECYAAYKKEYDTKRRLKKGHTPLGTICVCETCQSQFELKQGHLSNICSSCRGNS